jgi:transcription elongation factor GreB
MDIDEESVHRIAGAEYYMTPSCHDRLRAELADLRRERHRVVEIVAWAAGNGDRSENADYQYGKKRLREIDRRLRFLGQRLEKAVVVDPSTQTDRQRVYFGATVTYAGEDDEERVVTILGVDEADLSNGSISLVSPVARALLRARVGDELTVRTPRGAETIEVLRIAYPEPAKAH